MRLQFEHHAESTIRTIVPASAVSEALHEVGANGCYGVMAFYELDPATLVALDLDLNSDYWVIREPEGGGYYGYLDFDNVAYIAAQAWNRGE